MQNLNRTRWAAIGAAVAITLGAGGLATVNAAVSSGERTVFVPITPCRLVDTRVASTVGPRSQPLSAGETHDVTAHGDHGGCDVPTDATALALNVTALDASAPTYLTIWAQGTTRPEASSLNPLPGQGPTPNAVTTDLSNSGRFSIYNRQGVVDVIVDVTGYYASHDHDDRYYTRSEIDASDAGEVIAMGLVSTIGPTILAGRTRPGVAVAVTNPEVGRIDLTVTGADTAAAPIVVVTPHNVAAAPRTCNSRLLMTENESTYTVRLNCYDGDGNAATTSFQYLVAD